MWCKSAYPSNTSYQGKACFDFVSNGFLTFSGKGRSPNFSLTSEILCSCSMLSGALLSHSSSEITFRKDEGVPILEMPGFEEDAAKLVRLSDEVSNWVRRIFSPGV